MKYTSRQITSLLRKLAFPLVVASLTLGGSACEPSVLELQETRAQFEMRSQDLASRIKDASRSPSCDFFVEDSRRCRSEMETALESASKDKDHSKEMDILNPNPPNERVLEAS